MTTVTEQNRRWFSDKETKWSRFWSRLGFAEVPDLKGKTLLDVGSGLGANSLAAADAGALVTALEPDETAHIRSKELIGQKDPELAEAITFVNKTIEDFADTAGYDYIICDEVFEHLLDFRSAIDAMGNLLNPGGLLCSGWGPLWCSPIGGHQLTMHLAIRNGLPRFTTKPNAFSGRTFRIPYSHRMLTAFALNLYSRERDIPVVKSARHMGMNALKVREFRTAIENAAFNIDAWHENAGDHSMYKLLQIASKLPWTRNLFASNVYAVLSRR